MVFVYSRQNASGDFFCIRIRIKSAHYYLLPIDTSSLNKLITVPLCYKQANKDNRMLNTYLQLLYLQLFIWLPVWTVHRVCSPSSPSSWLSLDSSAFPVELLSPVYDNRINNISNKNDSGVNTSMQKTTRGASDSEILCWVFGRFIAFKYAYPIFQRYFYAIHYSIPINQSINQSINQNKLI